MTHEQVDEASVLTALRRPSRIEIWIAYSIFVLGPWFILRPGGPHFEQGSSFYIADPFLLVAIVLGAVDLFRLRGNLRAGLLYVMALGGAFLLWLLLALIPGARPTGSAAFHLTSFASGFVQYGYVLIGIPVVAVFVDRVISLDQALKAVSIGFILSMGTTLAAMGWWIPPEWKGIFVSYGRANGTVGNPNVFATVVCLVAPAYIYLTASADKAWRFAGVIGLSISISIIFTTLSFSGVIGLGVLCLGSGIYLLCHWHSTGASGYRDTAKTALAVTLCAIAITSVTVATSPEVSRTVAVRYVPLLEKLPLPLAPIDVASERTFQLQDVGSARVRLDLINRALSLLSQRHWGILSGHGLRQTVYLEQFRFGAENLDVHLLYLLLWIEGGLLAPLLYILYLAAVLVLGLNVKQIGAAQRYAALAPMVSFLVMGMFMPHMYLRFFWIPLIPAFMLAARGGLQFPWEKDRTIV